jgi:hypothetical protein
MLIFPEFRARPLGDFRLGTVFRPGSQDFRSFYIQNIHLKWQSISSLHLKKSFDPVKSLIYCGSLFEGKNFHFCLTFFLFLPSEQGIFCIFYVLYVCMYVLLFNFLANYFGFHWQSISSHHLKKSYQPCQISYLLIEKFFLQTVLVFLKKKNV